MGAGGERGSWKLEVGSNKYSAVLLQRWIIKES